MKTFTTEQQNSIKEAARMYYAIFEYGMWTAINTKTKIDIEYMKNIAAQRCDVDLDDLEDYICGIITFED